MLIKLFVSLVWLLTSIADGQLLYDFVGNGGRILVRIQTRTLSCLAVFSACVFATGSLVAEPISFVFQGVVTEGTFDTTTLNGQPFTIEGNVTDETNVSSDTCCGIFAAENTTFRFSGGEVFVADDGTTFFSQQNVPNVPAQEGGFQVTLQTNSPNFISGMFGNGSQLDLYANPNEPEAVGFVRFHQSGVGNAPTLTLENDVGQKISIDNAAWESLETYAIPEPSGFKLCLPIIAFLLSSRKRTRGLEKRNSPWNRSFRYPIRSVDEVGPYPSSTWSTHETMSCVPLLSRRPYFRVRSLSFAHLPRKKQIIFNHGAQLW